MQRPVLAAVCTRPPGTVPVFVTTRVCLSFSVWQGLCFSSSSASVKVCIFNHYLSLNHFSPFFFFFFECKDTIVLLYEFINKAISIFFLQSLFTVSNSYLQLLNGRKCTVIEQQLATVRFPITTSAALAVLCRMQNKIDVLRTAFSLNKPKGCQTKNSWGLNLDSSG